MVFRGPKLPRDCIAPFRNGGSFARWRGARRERAFALGQLRPVAGVGRAELDRTRAPAERQGFASRLLFPFERSEARDDPATERKLSPRASRARSSGVSRRGSAPALERATTRVAPTFRTPSVCGDVGRGVRPNASAAGSRAKLRPVAGVGRAGLDQTRAPAERQGFASQLLSPFERSEARDDPATGRKLSRGQSSR